MKLAISSGHGKYVRGASGYLDEVNEARRVVDRVNQLWNENGVTSVKFHDDTSTSQSANLNAIVNWHNRQSRDYDVSVHFNAYQTTTSKMGVEVLYKTQQTLASNLSAAMASVMSLPNRGGKLRNDLAFLNGTAKPAILIETCFVDSSADAKAYNANFEAVCKCIAEVVGKITIGDQPPEPIEPPDPEPGPEIAHLDIVTTKTGDFSIVLNGQSVDVGAGSTENIVNIDMAVEGSVKVTINGQDYNNIEGLPPPGETVPTFPANQSNIICTVFGGSSDPNSSAYSPYDTITDTEESVALPWKFTERERFQVLVRNDANGKEVVTDIRDVGPWLTDDNYWSYGTRPLAETCYLENRPLPRGPHAGKVPNGAGADITPGAAKAIGLSGKGKISWTFINSEGDAIS